MLMIAEMSATHRVLRRCGFTSDHEALLVTKSLPDLQRICDLAENGTRARDCTQGTCLAALQQHGKNQFTRKRE